MSTMRGAIIIGGQRQVELREFPVPEPGPGQVLLRMKAAGMCGSDLHNIYRTMNLDDPGHYRGCIAGHEPCGTVEAIGPGCKNYREGDRVIVYHITGCRNCYACRKGWIVNCTSDQRSVYGWHRDGAYADFMLAEEYTLLKLPEELSFIDGAIISCGFGTSFQGVQRADVSGYDTVLVVGLGPVGLAAAIISKARGANVIGVDISPERVAAAEKLGCDLGLIADDEALNRIREYTNGHGVEVSLECSASQAGRMLSLESARLWGRVVLLGEHGNMSLNPSFTLIQKQLTLHGSWMSGISEMEDAIEHMVRWKIKPEEIVTHTFPITEVKEAFELSDAGEAGKVVFVWD
jgi:threonine dehydrogenase-like Zn-dependent dehydrogenase